MMGMGKRRNRKRGRGKKKKQIPRFAWDDMNDKWEGERVTFRTLRAASSIDVEAVET